jgi:hypothetical protein
MVDAHYTDNSKLLQGFSLSTRIKSIEIPCGSPLSTAREAICSAIESSTSRVNESEWRGGESMLHHVEKEHLSLPYLKKSIV